MPKNDGTKKYKAYEVRCQTSTLIIFCKDLVLCQAEKITISFRKTARVNYIYRFTRPVNTIFHALGIHAFLKPSENVTFSIINVWVIINKCPVELAEVKARKYIFPWPVL